MPASSKISVGFAACLVLGLLVCGIGLAGALSVKSAKMDCNPGVNSTVNNNEAEKPLSNGWAICVAAYQADSQAKVKGETTAALGCVLCGVAIMIAGVGFTVMGRNAPSSPMNGPRPPMPPPQPYPHPPQPRPQS